MSRFTRFFARACVLVSLAALVVAALSGCGSTGGTGGTGGSTTASATPVAVKIGTLATEDSLPLWVAEKMGYFSTEGIPGVEIVPFQSAQERDVALSSGAIDGFMGDIIAAANLQASGKGVKIATVMLGADQSQGRFGVVVPKGSSISDLKQLANVPVGTSSATIQEYVLDGLMAEAGVPADQVKVEEVKKVPVRFELLMANKLKAAALPEPFLTLAEQGGAKTLGDDTKSKANLSQTILLFSDSFLAKPGARETVRGVLEAWNFAANDINKNPDNYRQLLVEKAKLPAPLAASYKVNTYPEAAPPTAEEVAAVLNWMKTKGYLKAEVGYNDIVFAR